MLRGGRVSWWMQVFAIFMEISSHGLVTCFSTNSERAGLTEILI